MDNNFNGQGGQVDPSQNQFDQTMNQNVQQDANQFAQQSMKDANQFAQQSMQDANQFAQQSMQDANQFAQQSMQNANQFAQQPMQDANQFAQQPMQDFNQSYNQPNNQFVQPGVTPPVPGDGGKKPKKEKKPLSKGAIGGIIGGGIALIALIVCGIIFIPKFLKSDKEVVLDAFEETFAESNSGDYYSELIGSEDLLKTFEEKGGSVICDMSIDSIVGTEVEGLEINVTENYDKLNKKLDLSETFTYNGTDVLDVLLYADENNTYMGMPSVFEGYFSIPNKNFLKAIAASPMGQAAGLSESDMPEMDLDYFAEGGVSASDVKNAEAIWDKIEYKKQGKAKIDVNGSTVTAKEYYITLKEEDIEEILSSAMDEMSAMYTSNPEMLQEAGMDAETFNTSMAQVKQMIPSLVAGDLVIKVYIKDDKIVKISSSDEMNIMGVVLSYDVYMDFGDDISGDFKIAVAGEEIGIRYDIDKVETAPTGKIEIYQGANVLGGIDFTSEYSDTETATNQKITGTLTASGEEIGSCTIDTKFEKGSNVGTVLVDVNTQGEKVCSLSANYIVENIEKGSKFDINITDMKIEVMGEELVSMSMKYTINTNPSVTELDSSKPTYDITTMTESDLENFSADNADNIQAWMEKLEECGLSDLFGSSITSDIDYEELDSETEAQEYEDYDEEMATSLSSYDGSKEVEILGSLSGTEQFSGSEYTIVYSDDNSIIYYSIDEYSESETDSLSSFYEPTDVEISESVACEELELTDGTKVLYSGVVYATEYDDNIADYMFVRTLDNGLIMVVEVTLYNDSASMDVNEVAEQVISSDCFNIIK